MHVRCACNVHLREFSIPPMDKWTWSIICNFHIYTRRDEEWSSESFAAFGNKKRLHSPINLILNWALHLLYKAHWRIGRLLLCWVSTKVKKCVLIESEANLDSNVYSKYKFETCKPGECRQQKLKNGHQLRLSSVASCAPPECSRQALALLIALHPLRLINGVCVCVMSEYCVMPSTSVY